MCKSIVFLHINSLALLVQLKIKLVLEFDVYMVYRLKSNLNVYTYSVLVWEGMTSQHTCSIICNRINLTKVINSNITKNLIKLLPSA